MYTNKKKFYSYCQIAFSKGFVTHTHNMYQSLHISTKVLNLKNNSECLAQRITILPMTSVTND